LLGHSSALTTEKYLNRLDTTRIFADVHAPGDRTVAWSRAAEREAAAEFDEEDGV
jgi:hypothetical protein